MRFKNLGSGSTGNATLVESGGRGKPVRVLVDCGLNAKTLTLRLGEAGLYLSDINGIFITHEHGDHIGCAPWLAKQFNIAVWMSRGTHAALGSPALDSVLRLARDGEAIDFGQIQLTPFTVPHDAREPLQVTCSDGNRKLGLLTDLGHATPHVLAHLENCHCLMLESNHDSALLSQSRYPTFLKNRVGGPHGHLSNDAASAIARTLSHPGLKHLVAAHLSAENNRPVLAQTALAGALGCLEDDIMVADPVRGTPWLTV